MIKIRLKYEGWYLLNKSGEYLVVKYSSPVKIIVGV